MRHINIKPYYVIAFLFLASTASLAFAYIAQYGFGLKPCHLCLYQRIPYMAVAVLSLLLLLPFCRNRPILAGVTLLCGLLFLIDSGIAFYHMGVEHHWFEGPSTCTVQGKAPTTIEEMREQIYATPAVRCDEPAFIFLGLSMAGWNMVWAATLGLITIYMHRNIFNGKMIIFKN